MKVRLLELRFRVVLLRIRFWVWLEDLSRVSRVRATADAKQTVRKIERAIPSYN